MRHYPGRIDFERALKFFTYSPFSRYWITDKMFLRMNSVTKRVNGETRWLFTFRLYHAGEEKPICMTASPFDLGHLPNVAMKYALGMIADDHIPVADRKITA